MTATSATTQSQTARPRLNAKGVFNLVKEAAKEWSEDKAPRLGAALAYYTVFSLAPLLILVISIAGLTLGQRESAQEAVISQLRGLVGAQGAEVIETAIENSSEPGAGILGTIISVGTLLFGALGAFGQLQDALNTIWEVKLKPGRGFLGVIKDRLLSFGMVLVIGFLLVVSLAASAALAGIGTFIANIVPGPEIVMEIINFVVSFVVISGLFALMFKYLPDAKIGWRDVIVGAVATALLFTIGKTLIGIYLGSASVTSTYGAAGSLVVLLLWMYYSAQIFLFGAELTQVYANRFGSRVMPEAHAERMTEAERVNEGMPRKEGETAGATAGLAAGPTAAAGLALAATGPNHQLAVVGPYEALPGSDTERALRVSEPWRQALERHDYVVALLTFAAGLGAGALVALGSSRAAEPPPKLQARRADKIRRNGRRR